MFSRLQKCLLIVPGIVGWMALAPVTAEAQVARAAVNQYVNGAYYGGYGGYGYGYQPRYYGGYGNNYGYGNNWNGYPANYPAYGYNRAYGYSGYPAYGYRGAYYGF